MLHLLPEIERAEREDTDTSTHSSQKSFRRQIGDEVRRAVRGEYAALHLLLEEGFYRIELLQQDLLQKHAEQKELLRVHTDMVKTAVDHSSKVDNPAVIPDHHSSNVFDPAVLHDQKIEEPYFSTWHPQAPQSAHAAACPVRNSPIDEEVGLCKQEPPEEQGTSKEDDMNALANANGWNVKKQKDQRYRKLRDAMPGTGMCSSIRLRLLDVAESKLFLYVADGIVLANSLFMGIQTEVSLSRALAGITDPIPAFGVIERLFTISLMIEWSIRVGAFQNMYFRVPEWQWHVFDTLLVVAAVVELVATGINGASISSGAQSTMLRVVRVFRIARLLRVVRFVSVFRELRLMMCGLLSSARSLMWSIVFLTLIMYVFGLFFSQAVLGFYQSGSFQDAPDSLKRSLTDRFGSVEQTMLTLFSSISGGINWEEAVVPLKQIHVVNIVFFCLYIMVTYHGVLHVMTGIFVDSAMMASRTDRDEVIADELSEQDSYMAQMRDILLEADASKTGTISLEDFQAKLKDERMQSHLLALRLDPSEALGYFSLLDTEGTGIVPVQEFVVGCYRLKGQAKGLDLASVMYENKKLTRIFTKFMQSSEMQYNQINDKMCVLCQHLHGGNLVF